MMAGKCVSVDKLFCFVSAFMRMGVVSTLPWWDCKCLCNHMCVRVVIWIPIHRLCLAQKNNNNKNSALALRGVTACTNCTFTGSNHMCPCVDFPLSGSAGYCSYLHCYIATVAVVALLPWFVVGDVLLMLLSSKILLTLTLTVDHLFYS